VQVLQKLNLKITWWRKRPLGKSSVDGTHSMVILGDEIKNCLFNA